MAASHTKVTPQKAIIEQDISNPGINRAKYADPSGETMKALVWMGKGQVQVREYYVLRVGLSVPITVLPLWSMP